MNAVLEAIRTRRVARVLTDAPLDRAQVKEVLNAARWAPSGGNRRLHRFVAVQDPVTLRLLRMVSPGMFQRPRAVILICIDGPRVRSFGMAPSARGLYVDVGTAAQTMLLAAHSLGLGAGPVTSFSRAAVARILNLPDDWSPEMFICLGIAAAEPPPTIRSRTATTWGGLIHWERFPSGPRA